MLKLIDLEDRINLSFTFQNMTLAGFIGLSNPDQVRQILRTTRLRITIRKI
jgi:hypothetical protein